MQASGLIRFEKLNALGVQILREAEKSKPRGVGFTFGPTVDTVLMRWDPSADFDVIYHLVGLLNMRDDKPGPPFFTTPKAN